MFTYDDNQKEEIDERLNDNNPLENTFNSSFKRKPEFTETIFQKQKKKILERMEIYRNENNTLKNAKSKDLR
jgi:hypothetical protein